MSVGTIRIVANDALPPGTMVVSEDLFALLTDAVALEPQLIDGSPKLSDLIRLAAELKGKRDALRLPT